MRENSLEDLKEPLYTINEASEITRLSKDSIRRWALRQPDVLIYQDPKPGKRTYRTCRVPASALLRLYPNISLLASPSPVVFTRKANKKRIGPRHDSSASKS